MDTTKLDDLLNQAEAQEAEQGEWIEDINYITKNFYVDEHGVVEVKNKTIGDMSKHISVKGESYSQYIEFKIGRFFDGIDLTKMQLAIYFSIPGVGEDESRPINVYYNENEIKFGWVIPPEVAQTNLTIEFCIYARGILSDGNNYVLKTKTATYQINDGLEIGSGIIEPTNNWYLNFVLEMDEKVSQASENADRAEQAASSLDGVVETVTTARDEVVQKASTVNTQHSEVESWHQEAEQFRNEAEQFRNQAEAITGIGLAEEGKPGIVQPDGVTTKVTEDGKLVVIGGGGGGGTPGTTDYEDLDNKPKINGVELSGNKTLEELGFEGTTDYQALENKPSIAGIELSGDKSYDELGLASKDAVARNFQTVNQNIQELDDYTQSLGEDIVALNTELEQTNQQLQSTTDKVDNLTERTESGIKVEVIGKDIHLTDAVDGKVVEFAMYGKSEQKQYSGKNLLQNTAISQTINGVTFTVNQDGSILVNGKTTVDTTVIINNTVRNLENGNKYVLSGCPSGGSLESYRLMYWTEKFYSADTGTSIQFTYDETVQNSNVSIRLYPNVTYTNLLFKPMIRLASIEDNTYEPYTNGASPNPQFPQPIEVSGESYNLLENTATSQTINGVEFVVNEDKSVTVNGTATANATYVLRTNPKLASGELIMSGCPSGGSENTFFLQYSSNVDIAYSDIGSGVKIKEMDSSKYPNIDVKIKIRSGYTAENLTFYPMIRKASVKNNRYMPYGVGSVEVKSVGKNKLNLEKSYQGLLNHADGLLASTNLNWLTSDFIEVNNQNISIYSNNASDNFTVRLCEYNSLREFIKCTVNTTGVFGNETKSLVLDSNTKYIRISYGFNNKITTKESYIASGNVIQVEEGTEVTPYEPYKETVSVIPVTDFAGIPVSSNGNYTDQNGQQWICDEVVKYADGSGVFVQRIGKKVVTSAGGTVASTNTFVNFTRFYINTFNDRNKSGKPLDGICDIATFDGSKKSDSKESIGKCYFNEGEYFNFFYIHLSKEAIGISVSDDAETQKALANEWLASNPMTVYYELAEPITTPLTAEELEEISTFYPVTNISNDFDCGMRIEYVGDSIITTNTEIPIVEPKDEEELQDGDNIITLFGKINKLLKNVGKGVVDVVDNLLSTSTILPLSANQGRILDEKITTLNDSLEDISEVVNEQFVKQMADISTRLSALEQNQKTIIYSDTEPETLEENTIVMVYETEE